VSCSVAANIQKVLDSRDSSSVTFALVSSCSHILILFILFIEENSFVRGKFSCAALKLKTHFVWFILMTNIYGSSDIVPRVGPRSYRICPIHWWTGWNKKYL